MGDGGPKEVASLSKSIVKAYWLILAIRRRELSYFGLLMIIGWWGVWYMVGGLVFGWLVDIGE